MMSDYEQCIKNELETIIPEIYDNLNNINGYSNDRAEKILRVLLEYSCLSQNHANITISRELICKINAEWLKSHYKEVAISTINFNDDWEYRRLLEVIDESMPDYLKWAINIGKGSNNEEIREIAQEFEAYLVDPQTGAGLWLCRQSNRTKRSG